MKISRIARIGAIGAVAALALAGCAANEGGTGGSTELALERIAPLGVVVTGVIPMVDRGDIAAARFAKRGIPFHALVSYRDLGIDPVKDV